MIKTVILRKLLAWLLMRCLKSWFSQSNSDCIRYSKVTRKGNSVKVRAQISCQALMAIIDMVYLSVEAIVIFYVLPRWYKLGVFNRDHMKKWKLRLFFLTKLQNTVLHSFLSLFSWCLVKLACKSAEKVINNYRSKNYARNKNTLLNVSII